MENDPEKTSLELRELRSEDIPSNFGFDKFGLLVQVPYAVAMPEDGPEHDKAPAESSGTAYAQAVEVTDSSSSDCPNPQSIAESSEQREVDTTRRLRP
jgi:hypothetical protein